MKRLIASLSLVLFAAGCGGGVTFGQVPQKQLNIVYTWTAPTTGCPSGCTYVLSTLSVANGTATCPASTGTNYVPVNESAPVATTTYTFLSATPGTSQCAIVQAYNGLYSDASVPSNVVVLPTKPGTTGAPTGNEQSASLLNAPLPADPAAKRVASAEIPGAPGKAHATAAWTTPQRGGE